LDNGTPPRVTSIGVAVGGASGATDPGDIQPPAVNGKMSNDELTRVLDAYFTKLAAADAFSGVPLVARNGVPVFHEPTVMPIARGKSEHGSHPVQRRID
jgi:hypothetical protein